MGSFRSGPRVARAARIGSVILALKLLPACGTDPVDWNQDNMSVFGDAGAPSFGRDASAGSGSGSDAGGSGFVDAGGSDRVDASAPSTRDAGSDPSDTTDAGDEGTGEPDASAEPDAGSTDPDPGDPGGPKPIRGKFVGNITTRGQVRSDFASMWNQITPENEGKWGSVERVRNQMDWSGLDRIYAYARQHGLVFKQHAFVWGSQQPNWIGSLPPAQQAAEVEEWIRLFCERYPDVELIDVVNEPPPHTTPVYMNALGGAGRSGYDWIVKAFQWAHQYCPNAILILNDYNTIEYPNDNANIIRIANAVKQAGAPIHALGAQAHDAFKHPTETVKRYLDKLVNETGLPVYITEYDINVSNDAQQRQIMENQFTMFWRHPNVKGITLWGYVSGATWLPNTGLMSDRGVPRPALTWLLDFLERERMNAP